MAYLNTLREFRPGRAWARLRTRLPVACVLCRTRTPGGLCEHCRRAVTASRAGGASRCDRCDVLLAGAGSAARSDESLSGAGCTGRSDGLLSRVGCTGQSDELPAEAGEQLMCPDCIDLPHACDGIVAAFDYQWPGDLLIHRLKSYGQFNCAPILAEMIADCLLETIRRRMPESGCVPELSQWLESSGSSESRRGRVWVTAIPSSRRSLKQRGYNPAAEIGRVLAHRLNGYWRPELLQRVHEGAHQKQLSRSERWAQVAQSYASDAVLHGEPVLVVDDVMTTGATLHSAAAVLKARGAGAVWGVVAARTPAPRPS